MCRFLSMSSARAELGEHVGDLGERHRLQVGERHRARERQAGRRTCGDRAPRKPPALDRPPNRTQSLSISSPRTNSGTRKVAVIPSIPCMKRSASVFTSSVAEQLIRSSSTPCFSL